MNREGAAGLGAAALVANVGYIPAKMVYAILGGVTGGFGYALTGGNQNAANSIWRSSLGGDYVVTPDMLSGQQPLHFSGPAGPDSDATQLAPAAGPAVSSNPPPGYGRQQHGVVYPEPAGIHDQYNYCDYGRGRSAVRIGQFRVGDPFHDQHHGAGRFGFGSGARTRYRIARGGDREESPVLLAFYL